MPLTLGHGIAGRLYRRGGCLANGGGQVTPFLNGPLGNVCLPVCRAIPPHVWGGLASLRWQ
jgi:hypothetical protein